MSNPEDYKKYAILYVDDEERSLKAFTRAFEDQFRIYTASTARDGIQLLEEHKDEIGLLMTDQRMPGENGVWLLDRARHLRPRIVRVLVTAFSDWEAVVEAVNTGAIYKYINKPWDPQQLEMTLKRGLEYFALQQDRERLLRENLAALRHVTAAERIVSMGLLAAGMSHHIRNSLVAVKTFLDLAPSKLKEEKVDMDNLRNREFWTEYHQNVLQQIERINDLLRDLWLASERPPFNFADLVHLPTLIRRVVADLEPVIRSRNLNVNLQLDDSLPVFCGDNSKLSRLFELLLKDEVSSLPLGSQVKITAALTLASAEVPAGIHVEVRDNGPGLPAESLRLLFDPFQVRNDSPQEIGIRLMACYFIAHHHGGKIEARHAEPHGTVFELYLPLDPIKAPPIPETKGMMDRAFAEEAIWEKPVSPIERNS